MKQSQYMAATIFLGTLLCWPALGGAAELTLVDQIKEGEEGVVGLDVPISSITVSPDGKNVYISGGHFSFFTGGMNFPATGSVVVFARDGTTGELTYVESILQGVNGIQGLVAPWGTVLSPNGAHFYVAAGNDSPFNRIMLVFNRNGGDGTLTFASQLVGSDGALDMTGDARHLYLVHGSVRELGRNLTTGALTFIGLAETSLAPLERPESVVISPDDRHVYVGVFEGAILAYARDDGDGTLSLLEVERNGQNGVTDLFNVTSVAISPDGRHVYSASACFSCPIPFFARNEANGTLNFLGSAPVQGGVAEVLVSVDGKFLYTVGGLDFVVYARNATTGDLTFVEKHTGNELGVGDNLFPEALGTSPDGRHIYVVSGSFEPEKTVAVFKRNSPVDIPNFAPTAANDSYSTQLNSSLVVAAADGVLDNDVDPEGQTLTTKLANGPANGVLSLNSNGSFIYMPDQRFIGTDSFTYRASDGTLDSNIAIVTITVEAVALPWLRLLLE